MSGASSSVVQDARRPNREWRRGATARSRQAASQITEFQRSRVLGAAIAVASEHGYAGMTATAVVAHAGVSRKTFYDLFENREDCFAAVIEEVLDEIAAVVVPAYEQKGTWSEQLRAALGALLELLQREPKAGALALSYLIGHGSSESALRTRVLERLRHAVDAGREGPRARQVISPLTAEVVVAGTLTIIHARLQADPQHLSTLLNPLMWTIVLPYRGPGDADRQLRRPELGHAARPSAPARAAALKLDMRLTYRTASTIRAIGAEPGASNVEVSARVGIADQGQISKLLNRLARLGLIENAGAGQAHGAANAWHLTDSGRELEARLGHESLAGRPRDRRRRV